MTETSHTRNGSAANRLRRTAGFFATVLRRNIVRGTRPYKAHLILTWACQARCVMCDIWKRQPYDELTLDEYDRFFRANPYLQWCTFSGGEPFDRKDLVDIARLAHRHLPGLYCVNSPTNSLATDHIIRTVEAILAVGVPQYVLSISLDGPPDVHDRVRGLPGTFNKAMQVLKQAKALEKSSRGRFMVMCEHTLLPPAFGRFHDMVEAVQQHVPGMNAGRFLVATPNVSNHYYGNTAAADSLRTSVSPDRVEEALQHIIAERSRAVTLSPRFVLPQAYLNMARSYPRTGIPPMRCRATRSTIFIDPNGVVYPCNSYSRPLGQLREADYSIEKILAAIDINQLRKDIDDFKCGGCWTPCEASQSLVETVLHPKTAWRMATSLLPSRRPPPGPIQFDVPAATGEKQRVS